MLQSMGCKESDRTEQKQQQRSTMKLKKSSKMKSSVKGMHTYTYI